MSKKTENNENTHFKHGSKRKTINTNIKQKQPKTKMINNKKEQTKKQQNKYGKNE